MKKTLLLIGLLTILFQVKSQNTEVEIYDLKSNSIIKGVVVESSTDSLRIKVDSLQTMAFAKSDLEGNELPVSKEIKKFRRKLVRSELKTMLRLFPGMYQIRNGEVTKGRLMLIITSLGLVGCLVSVGVFAVGTATLGSVIDIFVVFNRSAIILATSIVLHGIGLNWSSIDNFSRVQKKVNSRYYYKSIL